MTVTLSSVNFNGQNHKYNFMVDSDPIPFTLEDKNGNGTLDVRGSLLEHAKFKKFLQDTQQVATEFRSRLPQELKDFHERATHKEKTAGAWVVHVCQGLGLSVDGLGDLVETSEPKPFKVEEKSMKRISFKASPALKTAGIEDIEDINDDGKIDAVLFDTSDGVKVSIKARSINYGDRCVIFDTTRAGVEEFLKPLDDLFATKCKGCNL